jgi:hypothetical protein
MAFGTEVPDSGHTKRIGLLGTGIIDAVAGVPLRVLYVVIHDAACCEPNQ